MKPVNSKSSLPQWLLGAMFVFAGVMHFVSPANYERIMPPQLPYPRALVLLSGLAEIAGGLGVLVPRTRRLSGLGLILLLIAVFPANVQMLKDAQQNGASQNSTSQIALALLCLRLPLQGILIWWVWNATQKDSKT